MKKIIFITLILGCVGLAVINARFPYDRFETISAPEVRSSEIQIIEVANEVDEQIYIEAEKSCTKYGLGENCINDLRAIAATETGGTFNCKKIGDGGLSHGCFQINFHWPRTITTKQTEEIKTSVNWTLDRLIATGYKTNRDRAIMKHNGTPNTKNTLTYLKKVNRYKAEMNN